MDSEEIEKEATATKTKKELAYGPARRRDGPQERFGLQAEPTYKVKIDVKKEGVQAT